MAQSTLTLKLILLSSHINAEILFIRVLVLISDAISPENQRCFSLRSVMKGVGADVGEQIRHVATVCCVPVRPLGMGENLTLKVAPTCPLAI